MKKIVKKLKKTAGDMKGTSHKAIKSTDPQPISRWFVRRILRDLSKYLKMKAIKKPSEISAPKIPNSARN